MVSACRGRLSDCPCCQTRPGRPISPPASSSMNACDGLTWRAFGWRFGLPVGLFVLETPPTNTFPLHGNGFPWLQNPPSAGKGAQAIPPNHRMNVIRCQRARLGFGAKKIGKARMSATIYFRSLAARCRTSARNCFDHFAREEFQRLAHEFDTRAEQLEYSTLPTAQAGWWLTRREQARGFEGDR